MSNESTSTYSSIYGGKNKNNDQEDSSDYKNESSSVVSMASSPMNENQMNASSYSSSYFNINHFFRHVFSMPIDRQADLLNTMQYSFIAIIPLVILNKLIQRFIPEANESKSSLEIIMEVLLQLGSMILGMFFIDRFATFFRPYSGLQYPPHSIFYYMLGFLLIVLTIQTKLGEKISILVDRTMTMYYGNIMGYKNLDKKNGKKDKNGSKPTGMEGMQVLPHPQMISKDSNSDSTSIHQLPVMQQSLAQSGQQAMYMQTSPTASQIQGPTMVNDGGSFEPMPADSALGGGFGSSW